MSTATQEPVREREVVVGVVDARPARVRSTDPEQFAVPSGREEEWRFTPLRRLHGLHDTATATGTWQVTHNAPDGVTVDVMDGVAARESGFVPSDRIAARAFAAPQHTVVVTVGREVEPTEPVVVSVHTTDVVFGHVVVDAGAHSRSSVVVEFTGDSRAAINAEVVVRDGASLSYVEVHDQERTAVHAGEVRATVGRDATYRGAVVTIGGDLIRVLPSVEYASTGGRAQLLGVLLAGPGQHHEARTYIDHTEPHCSSDVAYKAVLHGHDAHTVWVGDVYVRHTATDIDTYELNRNLLLDDGPRADSVPNLELETGNVSRAGHASVTGRLDADQLFYLQARGISDREARHLVVRGFFSDILERLAIPAVSDRVASAVEAALVEAPLS